MAFPWPETSYFLVITEAQLKTATKELGGSPARFDTLMEVLVNRKIWCEVYIRWNINLFVRVRGQSFVIIKFVTDVFTSNIISIFVAITKLFSVTRFQICTIFVSFRIRY